jgi:hypothetical protein
MNVNDFINGDSPSTSWTGILGYIIGVVVILIIMLVIVNYTITPIFRLYPGGPGYIPIPGGDPSQLFWKQGSGKPAVFSPFFDMSSNVVATFTQWSFALDIDITNPMHVSQSPRVLFHRGPSRFDVSGEFTPGAATTIQGLIGNYNVAIALLPDTTDLVVSVLNSSTEMENVVIPNVPVQTPFRIGVILSDTAMEVYLNGLLQRTRTFTPGTTPYNATGMFYPPQGINAEIAKVGNLHLWNSVITANQMRYATPGLMTVKTKDKSDIPTSSCLSGIEKEADSNMSSWSQTLQSNLSNASSTIQSNVNSASSYIKTQPTTLSVS